MMVYGTVGLFAALGMLGLLKNKKQKATLHPIVTETEIIHEIPIRIDEESHKIKDDIVKNDVVIDNLADQKQLPNADLIDRLFAVNSTKLSSIVETVRYTSRVPWLEGRPAWISDYASHYQTTRHFIARSLNKNLDYYTQKVSPGDRFNVLRTDKELSFYLVIDVNRSKLWFYCLDHNDKERVLLKTYSVGLGRKDAKRPSGYLTPLGKFTLGSKVAIYKPGTKGYFQDKQMEMIRIFGTRWIPFDKELSDCTDDPKGYGIHGAPWSEDSKTGQLVEDRGCIGKFDSDGCIRLYSEDIEELFSVIISRPTTIELVKDFYDAALPYDEAIQ